METIVHELTICISVRDGENYIDSCLEALTGDSEPFQTPICIVDHASRDRTSEILENWRQKFPNRIRVLRFDGHGLAAARNQAWRMAETPWVAFVDIDCQIQSGWAKAAYETIRTRGGDTRIAAFGGSNSVPRSKRLIYRAYSIFLSTYVGGHDSILNRPVVHPQEVDHVPTLNVIYRKSALEKVKGFDLTFVRVGEDIDLSYRLRQSGYLLWSCAGMTVEHSLRPSVSAWIKNMYLYGRGRCFYIKRHPPAFQVKFLAPLIVFLAYVVVSLSPGTWLLGLFAAHAVGIAAAIAPETFRRGESMKLWLVATGMVWMTHLAYGSGFFTEIFRGKVEFKA